MWALRPPTVAQSLLQTVCFDLERTGAGTQGMSMRLLDRGDQDGGAGEQKQERETAADAALLDRLKRAAHPTPLSHLRWLIKQYERDLHHRLRLARRQAAAGVGVDPDATAASAATVCHDAPVSGLKKLDKFIEAHAAPGGEDAQAVIAKLSWAELVGLYHG